MKFWTLQFGKVRAKFRRILVYEQATLPGHDVYSDTATRVFAIILDLSSSHPWSCGRRFFVWCFTSVPRRLWFRYWDARMDVGVKLAAVNFPYFFFSVFIELVPSTAGADRASHGVRLWRGGSASRVLPHRVSFPRVPLHGHQEVRKRPWPPLWGRGEMATLAPRGAQLVSGTSDARCLSVPFV